MRGDPRIFKIPEGVGLISRGKKRVNTEKRRQKERRFLISHKKTVPVGRYFFSCGLKNVPG